MPALLVLTVWSVSPASAAGYFPVNQKALELPEDKAFVAKNPLFTVAIDSHGSSLYHDVQAQARKRLEDLYARL